MIKLKQLVIGIFLFVFSISASSACTNFLVSKGASADGSTMITYNADAGGFMEPLVYMPAKKWGPNDMLEVHDWDTGNFLGKIKQAPETYLVIGNINEYQVSIGETTFTGRKELQDTNGIIDYGSLMRITLQRAKTAREAIKIMGDLVAEYGYYSTGESFSVADPNEVWILEMIGKGGKEKGAVWVAVRIPDGYVAAHANQARIRKFSLNDPENCIYAKDVITFAQKNGYYNPKKDGDFSFVDAYCPLDPTALLFCEGRVWSLFKNAAPSMNLSADYWRCVEGAEPYPLYIKPDKKLSVGDVFDLFRDHFDGTEWDMKKGFAAGPFGNPVRWKGLTFKIEGDSTLYAWERPISTQQTAFSFVSQMRSWMPREIGGIFWYGVDDNYTSVYAPIYCSNLETPPSTQGYSIKEFSLNSSFWVFNLVANLAYTRYDSALVDIQRVQSELENKFLTYQPTVEAAALELYKKDKAMAVRYLTDYSVGQYEMVVSRWRKLWEFMVMKYNDGYINDVTVENGRHPKGVGYGKEFFKQAIKDKPGYYEVKMRKNINE